MRGLGRLAAATTSTAKHPTLAYSTFSGGGRGRGRGAAFPEKLHGDDPPESDQPPPRIPGLGHGKGVPPPLPSFSQPSNLIFPESQSSGRGRGSPLQPSDSSNSKNPIFARGENFSRNVFEDESSKSRVSEKPRVLNFSSGDENSKKKVSEKPRDLNYSFGDENKVSEKPKVSLGLSFGVLRGGMGRGKVGGTREDALTTPTEENRHLRRRIPSEGAPKRGAGFSRSRGPMESPPGDREEATRRAMDVLSRGGRAQGGRGVRGRGTGRGRGGRFGGRGQTRDMDEHYGTGLFLGDNADGEKLATRLGEENMVKLKEAFEEMSSSVLPSPMEECYLEALHTNYSFEFDPEYHMVFTNPDIEEGPPILLPEALEKMKPFLMEYEGIKSQHEWEEVVKETMEKAPVLKELVDFYGGPDTVTAKQQNQELERVANTIPDDVPSSVKRFTDRALLSLQSNSGWRFGKKCQFMDKLTWEISQQYK